VPGGRSAASAQPTPSADLFETTVQGNMLTVTQNEAVGKTLGVVQGYIAAFAPDASPQAVAQTLAMAETMATVSYGVLSIEQALHTGQFELAQQIAQNTAALVTAILGVEVTPEMIMHVQTEGISPEDLATLTSSMVTASLAFQIDNVGGAFGQAPGGGKFSLHGGYIGLVGLGGTAPSAPGSGTTGGAGDTAGHEAP
jgi:hypothetical protein